MHRLSAVCGLCTWTEAHGMFCEMPTDPAREARGERLPELGSRRGEKHGLLVLARHPLRGRAVSQSRLALLFCLAMACQRVVHLAGGASEDVVPDRGARATDAVDE